ncbi:MAG: SIS domain-containing protein [Chloroflexota bacterium]
MEAEVREQPEVFGRILAEGRPKIEGVARLLIDRRPRFVLFAARGTSDHAALYGKYLVETLLGLPAGLVSPSSFTVYDARAEMRDVLLVAVSQSGCSPDLLEPLMRAQAGGAVTLAITNAPESPLARAAEFHLDVLAGPERSVAATKTYTAQLLTLFLLIEAFAGRRVADPTMLPSRARDVLAMEEKIAMLAVRYRFAEQILVTSRGYNYPTAREAALKLMETSYLVAHAFSGADLLHGPMAMIDKGFPVIAIVPPGPGGIAILPVLESLSERGADTMVVGGETVTVRGTARLVLPEIGPEVMSPIAMILPIQLLALHVARQRGEDPDRPRSLQKITETW